MDEGQFLIPYPSAFSPPPPIPELFVKPIHISLSNATKKSV